MFGVGAVKAGTGWLRRYLEGHPDCATPLYKELRYFDTPQSGYYDEQIKQARNFVQEIKDQIEAGTIKDLKTAQTQLNATRRWVKALQLRVETPKAYASYLTDGADGATVAADISSAYSQMPGSHLKQMAGLMAQTRFVYLLRDPIDRLWANVRLDARQKSDHAELVRGHALNEVDRILSGAESAMLQSSDYNKSLETFEQAIPDKNRKVLFYETLFRDDTIRDLCAFLGLKHHAASEKTPAQDDQPIKLDAARKNGLKKLLAPQYQAVQARFQTLPAAWQDNMARG